MYSAKSYDNDRFTHEVVDELQTESLYDATMFVINNYFNDFSCNIRNYETNHNTIYGH